MNVKPLSKTEIWASERATDDKFMVEFESENIFCDAEILPSLNTV